MYMIADRCLDNQDFSAGLDQVSGMVEYWLAQNYFVILT